MMSKNALSPQEVTCIVNPTAARNKWERRTRLREHIRRNLSCEFVETRMEKDEIIESAKRKSKESKMIVAVGGDGTIAHIIQGIIDSGRGKKILLGILTFGSGNAFRKSLSIPKNPKKALRVLSEGTPKEIDLIDIEGKMAGFASVGATAIVSQKKLQHKIQGLLGHLLASRILVKLPKIKCRIELQNGLSDDGKLFKKKLLTMRLFEGVIGKTNHFGYSWKAAPDARIDDGYLDITLFETGWLKYLISFPLNYLGLIQRTQKHFKAKKIIFQGWDLPVQYNGEFLGVRDKITFKVRPRALNIISPK